MGISTATFTNLAGLIPQQQLGPASEIKDRYVLAECFFYGFQV
jgi:hypothetical protein